MSDGNRCFDGFGYDWSLNGTHPFDDSSDREMFTAAVDVVVTF